MSKTRFTTEELSMIKSTFAENEKILLAMRKVFLQMPLSPEDMMEVNIFKGNDELVRVVRKVFLPELDGNAPLNQNFDLLMTLAVAEKTAKDAMPHIASRELLIMYIEQSLGDLAGKEKEEEYLVFEDLKPNTLDQNSPYDDNAKFARLIARNTIVQHVESCLFQTQLLAGTKEETPEETLERLSKSSNK